MPKKFILIILFLRCFFLLPMLQAMQASPPGAPSSPTIEFKESIHDFGEVTRGKTFKHNFLFKNTGNAVLIIKRVKAG